MFNLEKLNCDEFSLFSVEILLQSGRERRQVWTGTSLRQTSSGLFLDILIKESLLPSWVKFWTSVSVLGPGDGDLLRGDSLHLGHLVGNSFRSRWNILKSPSLFLKGLRRLELGSCVGKAAHSRVSAFNQGRLFRPHLVIKFRSFDPIIVEILLGEWWYRLVETSKPAWRRWGSWKMCHCRNPPFRLWLKGIQCRRSTCHYWRGKRGVTSQENENV